MARNSPEGWTVTEGDGIINYISDRARALWTDKEIKCDWCGKEIESAHVSGKTNVVVNFCSDNCVSDWEAHVD